MGMMNLSYFRDADIDVLRNIFEESYTQSHFSSAGYMTLNPMAEGFIGDNKARSNRLKQHMDDMSISGYLMATHPHHTSQKGVLIMTTDYMIDLCLGRLPEDCERFDEALKALSSDYRKSMIRHRQHIGRDHPFVTQKKLLAEKPELAESGPENAVSGKNIGHLVAMNFDCIDQDEKDTGNNAAKDISESYHEMVKEIYTDQPGPLVWMRGGSLNNYESLIHWISLAENDVAIIEYNHFHPNRVFFGERKTRTPADELAKTLQKLPDATISESIFLKEYVLMKEFFASQGILINL